MEGLEINSEKDRILISIDRKVLDEEYVLRMLERIQVEYLARKSNFKEKILGLAENIDEAWWENNKEDFLRNVRK